MTDRRRFPDRALADLEAALGPVLEAHPDLERVLVVCRWAVPDQRGLPAFLVVPAPATAGQVLDLAGVVAGAGAELFATAAHAARGGLPQGGGTADAQAPPPPAGDPPPGPGPGPRDPGPE